MTYLLIPGAGFTPDEVSGGHFPMLGHPVELADQLEAYRLAVLT